MLFSFQNHRFILLQVFLVAMLTGSLVAQDSISLDCKELQESSGVAASGFNPDFIWSHNDSGGQPRLYLFHRKTGKLKGTYELKDVANVDWEDMCSFQVGDDRYLAIADVGDNSKKRKHVEICIIQEPDFLSDEKKSSDLQKIKNVVTVEVRYPNDAAIDCESIAYDPANSRFILLTKEPISCRLFSLRIDTKVLEDFDDKKIKIKAEYLQGFSLSLVTGADICPKTRQLMVCNYGIGFLVQPSAADPLVWDRSTLKKIPLPKRKQGEAIAFINPTQLIMTSEHSPTPLWTTTIEVAK